MWCKHRKSSATQPVSAAICRVDLLGLPELEQILAESHDIFCATVHFSGFFTARVAMRAVLQVYK